MNAVQVKRIAGVTRIVDADTGRIARSKCGFALDGGRPNCKSRGVATARRQVKHINDALREQHGL